MKSTGKVWIDDIDVEIMKRLNKSKSTTYKLAKDIFQPNTTRGIVDKAKFIQQRLRKFLALNLATNSDKYYKLNRAKVIFGSNDFEIRFNGQSIIGDVTKFLIIDTGRGYMIKSL